jgi:hypothetical protein
MQNQSSASGKARIIKSLAIAGFISIIIAIAWIAMQLVHVVPGAFASLASLAEGVRQYQSGAPSTPNTNQADSGSNVATTTIALAADTRTVPAGESTTIRWSTTDTPGSYTFRYTCSDGVAIDLVGVAGITSIACDTNYNLGNVDSVTVKIDSEKERFAEITYEIGFLATTDTEPRATGSQTLAVVNERISELTEVASEIPPVSEPTPVPNQPTTERVNESFTQEFIYAIPSSDPNGFTDLSVRFLNTGNITNNVFSASALTRRNAGAIQFEVKNTGTKTSRTWTYTAALPNNVFTSTEQVVLKPNERAIITLGFPAADTASHRFVITVTESTDRNLTNNRFVQESTFR